MIDPIQVWFAVGGGAILGFVLRWWIQIGIDARQTKFLSKIQEHLDHELETLHGLQKESDELIQLNEKQLKLTETEGQRQQVVLAKLMGLEPEEARAQLLQQLRQELDEELFTQAQPRLEKAQRDQEQQAKALFLTVVERNAARWTGETTLVQVDLPNDEFKGRLIGRDGRNFKAFEQITGVSLIVDETPAVVFLTSFDPIRRTQAQQTLASLILDGRIHPGRIEELYQEIVESFDNNLIHIGQEAAEEAGISKLSPDTIRTMGRLQFRTSLSQNVLRHSIEVANIASSLAKELGLNQEIAKRAGFLHDIGKALGPEWGASHALAGMEFLKAQKEDQLILNAVGAHHYEISPSSPEATVVIAADSASGSRPGARHATADQMPARMAKIESAVQELKGVKQVHVFDGGKEVRVFVKPEEITDTDAARLAKQIARVAKEANEYPVPVKVTVIRETRVIEISQ